MVDLQTRLLWTARDQCTPLFEAITKGLNDYITIKARLTLSPGSRVILVPIPLVMRGVPAQIFFAVPGDKT